MSPKRPHRRVSPLPRMESGGNEEPALYKDQPFVIFSFWRSLPAALPSGSAPQKPRLRRVSPVEMGRLCIDLTLQISLCSVFRSLLSFVLTVVAVCVTSPLCVCFAYNERDTFFYRLDRSRARCHSGAGLPRMFPKSHVHRGAMRSARGRRTDAEG